VQGRSAAWSNRRDPEFCLRAQGGEDVGAVELPVLLGAQVCGAERAASGRA